jgi:amidohydrolase
MRRCLFLLLLGLAAAVPAPAQPAHALHATIDAAAAALQPKLIEWRRDLHQHPELSMREFRTAKLMAAHLTRLGLEVKTGVSGTGVVGILRGARPGPVVALRADMDGLPVKEEVDLPFKSTAVGEYNGRQVPVMHACGHDMHMAILMGAAEVLTGMKAELAGTVVFIFQPAEEGAPDGEEGGADVMVAEGVLDDPKVDAIFGLHVFPYRVGQMVVRPEGIMAASDTVQITVKGRQTHGALPWGGVDPIVVASQVVLGLQTIISRQADLTRAPAVLTLGIFDGGVRANIIPDEVKLEGTLRTFDPAMQDDVHERIRRTAIHIAQSAGATAEVTITRSNPVTWNDRALTERMAPSLRRVAPVGFEDNTQVTTTAEDFSHYQKKVPGMFFFLGVTPEGTDPATAARNHSPRFYSDEGALVPGVRAMASLAVDFLMGAPGR